ncbi:MAG: hypothetical protein IT430_15710 [Phycisphaerales bacterium]|nr:hypothetical protein [Phycisphaerales bacterium]
MCRITGLSAAAASLVVASSTLGQVYPNHPHGGWNGIPFWTPPCAYQQVFAAGQFGSAPINIHSFSFAPDSFYNGEDYTISNLVVRLGYTDKAPGGLSPDLPSNVRGSLTTVLNAPSFRGIVDSQGPDHFSMRLPFTTPFCYEPASGNLLVQIDLSGCSLGIAISTTYGLPDSTRAWNSSIFGNNTDTIAARMMFEVTPCSSGPALTLTGQCPGSIAIAWSGATPNRQMGIVYARSTGAFVVPGGPCAGTVLGLGASQIQLVRTVSTGSGSGSVNGNAGPAACGGYLQLIVVNGNPCSTSNVAAIP